MLVKQAIAMGHIYILKYGKNNHILDPRDFIEEYKLKDVSVE